ncbi:BlaI/MecI/CopY family transcriptional regulator [Facklamia hominis]|uniref:BlaI/MecI/CopY family transcriptional regulator n=1 Tax=Facklamia hominis TaxID=178214 RepID=UPI0029D41C9A|nr:BlaI/MecI/CopY family transcriptional regulator [Facklamia hominis]WPJ91231.1 BlaI/MecI/CopY family transcriptional regulator [Facklamia hominis]
MPKIKLTNKEHELLQILWDADQALTAKQIVDNYPGLVMSTTQTTLRNLLKRNLIRVQSRLFRQALSRTYAANLTMEEYIVKQYPKMDIVALLKRYNKAHSMTEDQKQALKDLL